MLMKKFYFVYIFDSMLSKKYNRYYTFSDFIIFVDVKILYFMWCQCQHSIWIANICFPHISASSKWRLFRCTWDATTDVLWRSGGWRHGFRFTALFGKCKYYFYGDFSRKIRVPRLRLAIARPQPLGVFTIVHSEALPSRGRYAVWSVRLRVNNAIEFSSINDVSCDLAAII